MKLKDLLNDSLITYREALRTDTKNHIDNLNRQNYGEVSAKVAQNMLSITAAYRASDAILNDEFVNMEQELIPHAPRF